MKIPRSLMLRARQTIHAPILRNISCTRHHAQTLSCLTMRSVNFSLIKSVHMTYVMSTRCKKIIIDCFLLNLYLPIVVDLASKDRILHANTFMYSVGLTNTTLNENLEDTDGEKSNRTRKQTTKKNTCKAFSIKVHWRSYSLGAEWNRDTCLVTSLFAIW